MTIHPGILSAGAVLILCAALPGEDRSPPTIGGVHGKTAPGGGGSQTTDAQMMLQELQRNMATKGDPGATPTPGTSTHSSHCTATVNGKTVYDGPGSSVSVSTSQDGKGRKDEVTVDGKRLQGH